VSVDFEWVFADESWLDDAFEVRLEDGSVSAGDDFICAWAFRPAFDSSIGLYTDEGFSGFEGGGGDIGDFHVAFLF
jgi:hypothetical protein